MRPAAILPFLLAACASAPAAAPPPTTAPGQATTAVTEATPSSVQDPYELYLARLPADVEAISREDAQLRAMIGCHMAAFAPGTVDAILQEAYAPLIEGWRQQGLCDRE